MKLIASKLVPSIDVEIQKRTLFELHRVSSVQFGFPLNWRQMELIERFILWKSSEKAISYVFILNPHTIPLLQGRDRKLTEISCCVFENAEARSRRRLAWRGATPHRVRNIRAYIVVSLANAYLVASPHWVRFVYDKSLPYAVFVSTRRAFPRFFTVNVNEACARCTFHHSMIFADVSVVAFMLINTVVLLVCRATCFARMSWIFFVRIFCRLFPRTAFAHWLIGIFFFQPFSRLYF